MKPLEPRADGPVKKMMRQLQSIASRLSLKALTGKAHIFERRRKNTKSGVLYYLIVGVFLLWKYSFSMHLIPFIPRKSYDIERVECFRVCGVYTVHRSIEYFRASFRSLVAVEPDLFIIVVDDNDSIRDQKELREFLVENGGATYLLTPNQKRPIGYVLLTSLVQSDRIPFRKTDQLTFFCVCFLKIYKINQSRN